MASVCFYFQVHQPYRLRHYTIFDTAGDYFDGFKNAEICRKVARKCYLPTNRVLQELIERHGRQFKVSFSITGTVLEQFAEYAPEVLASFQYLAATGCVEFLCETYHHSLSFLFSPDEFVRQVVAHRQLIRDLFGQTPQVFRNTELIYNNQVAEAVARIGGFKAILAEGADHILGYRSPNYVYRPPSVPELKLLLKNYRLSDDVAFRFSNRYWSEWPLSVGKFCQWVNAVNGNGYVVNLFVDYETFGEHQWEDTGIFDFLRELPTEILKHPDNDFKTPGEVADAYEAADVVDVPHLVSWADTERDLSAWLGNAMQQNAIAELYRMEQAVRDSGDPDLLRDWRRLQTSDHFYYMCTKYFADGDVHKYFNPYDTPYDSYINFMNVLNHMRSRCGSRGVARPPAARLVAATDGKNRRRPADESVAV
ncbi:MAG: glycoside hydrolase family 57 protein [Sedimentisphaerales bacterium]|jgi:alpha-amylase|nr:glycoside hydrolase family 57 protein [Sedimentisphaerales bacterium]HNY76759.1 glycoside hydrolase family 57 protein [Sedimentisphaerales bacterium]HOC61634.1 glycoside hydrolase family 57 protein [Sedimentisphaerales bacterium]HOH62466.1 glycoside hydrolase family 57 protein [Sedimentisphaerales bacterium]HQA88602.1 glycoside hydrolase family 57 protein [Sedimentisphaerales bacterium]